MRTFYMVIKVILSGKYNTYIDTYNRPTKHKQQKLTKLKLSDNAWRLQNLTFNNG